MTTGIAQVMVNVCKASNRCYLNVNFQIEVNLQGQSVIAP